MQEKIICACIARQCNDRRHNRGAYCTKANLCCVSVCEVIPLTLSASVVHRLPFVNRYSTQSHLLNKWLKISTHRMGNFWSKEKDEDEPNSREESLKIKKNPVSFNSQCESHIIIYTFNGSIIKCIIRLNLFFFVFFYFMGSPKLTEKSINKSNSQSHKRSVKQKRIRVVVLF